MKLRQYQEEVVSKIMWAKDLPGNDVIAVCQGGGKSLIIAETAHRLNKPVLVICPNKEILEQDIDKMLNYVGREEIGVFSASMGEKTIKRITFGTIQSMYKQPELFSGFDIVIYDECDLHNPKNLEGMSTKLFKQAGIEKVFGFTGTPFRQDHYYNKFGGGRFMIETVTTTKIITRMKPFFWKRMLCVINTQDLLEQGYLSRIEYHDVSIINHDEIATNKSKSDFDLKDFEEKTKITLPIIAKKIAELPHKGKLVFCASIEQANKLQSLIENSVVVTSETSRKDREKAVLELRQGQISTVLNVGIFTVGFDYPELDCIVLLRPTRSLRLHCQILGRVSRIAEGKECGHVYDFVSNIKNLGELAEIKIKKNNLGLWDVMGGKYPNGFHMQPLYTYTIKKNKQLEKEKKCSQIK